MNEESSTPALRWLLAHPIVVGTLVGVLLGVAAFWIATALAPEAPWPRLSFAVVAAFAGGYAANITRGAP